MNERTQHAGRVPRKWKLRVAFPEADEIKTKEVTTIAFATARMRTWIRGRGGVYFVLRETPSVPANVVVR